MPNELREKIAQRYCTAMYMKDIGDLELDSTSKLDSYNFADSIFSLIESELEKAEEVDTFIGSCSLNPLHGCYRTCAECFFRMSCAKIKSKAEAKT